MTAEKCDVEGNMKANNFLYFMMKGPESTTAVLTQGIQQWQRAIHIGLRLINSAELSWCRVFRKGPHDPCTVKFDTALLPRGQVACLSPIDRV